jgi:S-methylmethionine-dependent homocysteine/selenocysteine methylase
MSPEEAKEYHLKQIAVFSETDADVVSALTMNYVEAIGIANAAWSINMPFAI